MVNNTEVAAPPSMTSRHSIRTSGRNPYIAENTPVMMTKETTKFRTCKTTSCAGRMEAENAPSAAIHALTAKETTKRKPMASTSANENSRSFTKLEIIFRPLSSGAVSYTHLRAHETRHDLVCR